MFLSSSSGSLLFKQSLTYLCFLLFALILSGFIINIFSIRSKTRSAVQHFSAGVVFSALSVELVPVLSHTHFKKELILGFTMGTILMLFIQHVFSHEDEGSLHKEKNIITLLFAVGIDVFIDGLLMGVSFIVEFHKGTIICLALSLELLFLGLSVAVSLQKAGKTSFSIICINFIFALLVASGCRIGLLFVNASKSIIIIIVAFAASALIYLVTEELLKRAHEEKDTFFATSMFFLGFLIVLLLG